MTDRIPEHAVRWTHEVGQKIHDELWALTQGLILKYSDEAVNAKIDMMLVFSAALNANAVTMAQIAELFTTIHLTQGDLEKLPEERREVLRESIRDQLMDAVKSVLERNGIPCQE